MNPRDAVEYYFHHVGEKKDGKKAHKLAIKLTKIYAKYMDKAEAKFKKKLKPFIKKNHSMYINDYYAKDILDLFFEEYHQGFPDIVTTGGPTKVRLAYKFKGDDLHFDAYKLPNGDKPSNWEDAFNYFDSLNPKDFYFEDTEHKKFTYKQFKKFVAKYRWDH